MKHGVKQNAKWRKETAEYFRKSMAAGTYLMELLYTTVKNTWIERYRKKGSMSLSNNDMILKDVMDSIKEIW